MKENPIPTYITSAYDKMRKKLVKNSYDRHYYSRQMMVSQ